MAGRGVVAEDLKEIKLNLEGLTMNIHDVTVDEFPQHY